MQVVTTGDITMSGVTADGNYLYGAYLEGETILVNESSFSNNGTGVLSDHVGSGLTIKSTGTGSIVDLTSVKANGNQLYGANVQAEGTVICFRQFLQWKPVLLQRLQRQEQW